MPDEEKDNATRKRIWGESPPPDSVRVVQKGKDSQAEELRRSWEEMEKAQDKKKE